MLEHKAGIGSVFASQYQLTDLVHFEKFENMTDAIRREKQLKNWHAEWKWNLVRETNKDLADLAFDWFSVNEIEQFRIDMESEYL